MIEHGKKICRECSAFISQCRCVHHTTVSYGLCGRCFWIDESRRRIEIEKTTERWRDVKLPNYLVEVRNINWEMADEFGHRTHLTMAQEVVAVRVVNPTRIGTYHRHDGYENREEVKVGLSNGDWAIRIQNYIDYTGGYVWRSDGVYETDDPFRKTKHRVFLDPSQLRSAKLVLGGKPLNKESLEKFQKPIDKWFEI